MNRKRPSSLFTRRESLQERFPFGLRTLSDGDRGELRGDDGIHQKTRCEAGAAVCFGWVSRNA